VPEAPREQCLAAVADLLRTMTGPRFWAEDGMTDAEKTYPNPITVERRFVVPAQRAEFPRLCVIDASGARREFGATGGIGRYVDHFVFMLYGYVIGTDQVTRATALARLEYDCFLTLARATMPTGYIRNFDFSRPAETDQGADEPVGIFAWPIEAVLDDEVQAA
jgi:hypothetical protein